MCTNKVASKPQFSLIACSFLDNLKATIASITDTHDKDIEEVIETDVSPINIKEAEDIKPHLIAQMKAEYCQVLQKYLEAINGAENLGPYRAQAVFDIFQTSIIDQVQTLSQSIEKVQQGGIDKAQALLSEYQRQERSLQDLVNFQREKMQQQD